jgi:aspartate aminotransferase
MEKLIKEKIKKLKPSATIALNEKSKKLISEGKKIYKFGFGQSPFPVPKEIQKELSINTHRKDYLPMQGLLELRQAISSYLNKRNKFKFDFEDIIVGPGSKELMFILNQVFNGDIILPAPSWVSYAPQADIGNNKVHWIETSSETNWFPTAAQLEKKIKKIRVKKILLILNSPNNPSGATCNNFKEIADVVKKYKILVLSDEIYSELTFSKKIDSISNYCPDNTIISSGLSKWCGAGGWRLGYFVIPNALSKLKNSMKVLASETFSAVSAPIQFAAISAFNNDHTDYILKSKKILKGIGEYVYNNLKSNNVIMNKPMGGFYLMPEFLNKKFNTSAEMCTDLLNKKGVAILPGSDFGFSIDKMISRLSYTDFDGKNFMSKINLNTTIDDGLINKYAPKVAEGTKRLKEWVEIG